MSEWQDIETAPKDGTAVLVYATRDGWTDGARIVCARFGGLGPRWSIYGCGPIGRSEQWLDVCNPTHWMPLPPPPQDASQ